MSTKETKLDTLIAKMDKLTEKEKGGLLGGVSSFQLLKGEPSDDTNYFQCGCNNYQCGRSSDTI